MKMCCRPRSSGSKDEDTQHDPQRVTRSVKPLYIPRPESGSGDGGEHIPHRSSESCGVGINFRISENGDLVIDGIVSGGPADRTGKLKIGDELIRVDGRFVRGRPASQIAPKVLGPAGTIVELAFKRSQGPAVVTINVAVIRETPRDAAMANAAISLAPEHPSCRRAGHGVKSAFAVSSGGPEGASSTLVPHSHQQHPLDEHTSSARTPRLQSLASAPLVPARKESLDAPLQLSSHSHGSVHHPLEQATASFASASARADGMRSALEDVGGMFEPLSIAKERGLGLSQPHDRGAERRVGGPRIRS